MYESVRRAISDGRPYRDSNESGFESSIRKTTSARIASQFDLTVKLPYFLQMARFKRTASVRQLLLI
ncbi:MAG TPA: hypothetical protein VGF61_07385, partial [Candidatus Acidoferrum sp.]